MIVNADSLHASLARHLTVILKDQKYKIYHDSKNNVKVSKSGEFVESYLIGPELAMTKDYEYENCKLFPTYIISSAKSVESLVIANSSPIYVSNFFLVSIFTNMNMLFRVIVFLLNLD